MKPILLLCLSVAATGIAAAQETPELKLGPWRGVLACPGGEIPFGIELARDESGALAGWIRNGEEKAQIGRVELTDVLTLHFDPYDSRIVATVTDDGKGLVGEWVRYRGPGRETRMAFTAVAGSKPRFKIRGTRYAGTGASLAGRWRVSFSESEEPAVALFRRDVGYRVGGTFLTTLGDYRYLAGVYDGNQLLLSCFDGAHAFLFAATKQEDGSLAGDFWSRDAWHETWTAVKDPEAALPDPFALTSWTDTGLQGLAYPDVDGNERSLTDPDFQGPARILVLFGTWCPNCNDGTDLLVDLDARYRARGLRIQGLAFEFGEDFERNARVVGAYADYHGATFPMLIAGVSDKARASEAFGAVDRVRAYPTFLFLDAHDRPRAIYTGFSGPATGEAHERLVERFEGLIEELLDGDGEGD